MGWAQHDSRSWKNGDSAIGIAEKVLSCLRDGSFGLWYLFSTGRWILNILWKNHSGWTQYDSRSRKNGDSAIGIAEKVAQLLMQ